MLIMHTYICVCLCGVCVRACVCACGILYATVVVLEMVTCYSTTLGNNVNASTCIGCIQMSGNACILLSTLLSVLYKNMPKWGDGEQRIICG